MVPASHAENGQCGSFNVQFQVMLRNRNYRDQIEDGKSPELNDINDSE